MGAKPKIVLGALLLAVAAGCTSPAADIRHRNAGNLERLEAGMSRQQVIAIMGVGSETVTEDVYMEQRLVDYQVLTVQNPYRSEIREMGGDQWEILYYYAMPNGMGMGYWDTQYREATVPDWFLTPVVLKNGFLAGWGRGVLERTGLAEIPPSREQLDWLSVGS